MIFKVAYSYVNEDNQIRVVRLYVKAHNRERAEKLTRQYHFDTHEPIACEKFHILSAKTDCSVDDLINVSPLTNLSNYGD